MSPAAANFAAYCAQVAIVTGVGALLPYAFRLAAPRVRLLHLHLVLLACVALPLIQPWRAQPVVTSQGVEVRTGPAFVKDSGAPESQPWDWTAIGIGIVAAGGAARLLLLCAAGLRLRRLRIGAQPMLPVPECLDQVQKQLGAQAAFFISTVVTSPVTFGVRRPVVLVPEGFDRLPAAAQEAIACHELLHVQRKDWLFAIAEELLRCALWFHPAIWWLLGKIQLTREQVVDQAAVELTQSREQYVDALLTIAASRMQSDLAPAPLFLKRRHLQQRVISIMKGVSMSKRDLLVSSLAVFSALPLVVGLAAWQFPLNAAPQEVADARGVTLKPGPFKILHRTRILYPQAAWEKGVSGSVVASVTVNPQGEVVDARIVNGPEELRGAVLQSVLQWHFATDPWEVAPGDKRPMPSSFEIAIVFEGAPSNGAFQPGVPRPSDGKAFPIESVDLSSLPAALRERVAAAGLLREGEVIAPDRFFDVERSLKSIDSHLRLQGSIRNNTSMVMHVTLQDSRPAMAMPAAAPTTAGGAPSRIRIGGNVQAANLIEKFTPMYPQEAKAARIQGTVSFNATIGRDGHIIDLQLISGHPILVSSALEAVKQWVYKPTLLNGNPVEVITQIDVNYTLTQ